MGSILVKCAMIDLTIQWVLWAAASILQTEKFYDLAGSGTFIFLTHLSYRWNGTSYHRQKIQSTLVTVWGLRLGLFLFLRVLKEGRDRRFNEVRTSPKLFFVYWTLQETIADQQKWNFKSHPDNVGKFIQTGLWAYSRHPNYFGEILQWTGLFISASSVMKGVDYVSVLSPIFLWYLLTHVSGIPILEKQAMSRWGHDPTYLQYVRNTPALWPFTF
ncbi:uncharacterized protein si:ch211-210c8.6 isoform X2 [Hemiscyllium ocellatum]|uniref:uncharacterized protein si:ch211-210c8.6 isoform X2 n=1 Tax=Hemiscyllium ocellatum TaxID=170820 RepID=UPI0029670260|nr:uncharacterized protein si:ch211-210c8.6 isoform X2 [Hemiscyllium ocellatum]